MNRGLRLRLAASAALSAALLSGLTGGVVLRTAQRAAERRHVGRLDEQLDAVELRVRDAGSRLEQALEGIAGELETTGQQRMRRLFDGGAAAVGEARVLNRWAGLDMLAVVDPEGRVVSSADWPELAGLRQPRFLEAPSRRAALARIEDTATSRPALVARLELPQGGRTLWLVGGRALESVVDQVRSGPAVVLFDVGEGGAAPVVGGRSEGLDLAACAEVSRRPGAAAVLASEDRQRWTAKRRAINDAADRPAAVVVAALPRADLEADFAQHRMLLAAFVAAVALLAAAAGTWLAGRIVRPVDRLVRAVDAIAAGEADYTFPRRSADAFDELEQAFSRLQRSLDTQTRRSLAAERVAAWREVARHVAHEVKNPLAPIRLTIENLQRARGRDPAVFDALFDEGAQTILEEVAQLSRLVNEFSEFARMPRPTVAPTEIHDLIDGVLDLYAAEPGLTLERRYEAGRPAVLELDADQISRALKNIVANAVEAMREAGPDKLLRVQTTIEDSAVCIRIDDSGPGLPPEAEGRVFQPYFTTKSHGTGLGMAITDRIVTEHGGVVAAESLTRGARLTIRLPLVAGPREEVNA